MPPQCQTKGQLLSVRVLLDWGSNSKVKPTVRQPSLVMEILKHTKSEKDLQIQIWHLFIVKFYGKAYAHLFLLTVVYDRCETWTLHLSDIKKNTCFSNDLLSKDFTNQHHGKRELPSKKWGEEDWAPVSVISKHIYIKKKKKNSVSVVTPKGIALKVKKQHME